MYNLIQDVPMKRIHEMINTGDNNLLPISTKFINVTSVYYTAFHV